MNFITQLGLLAIILIILVILIKSNQTLEQIYMEGESEKDNIEIPPFQMPEFHFSDLKKKKRKEEPVERSSDTIPVEITSGWYMELVDQRGRSFGRAAINTSSFSIGRSSDNDYVIDDLSVSGHHACVEEEHGILTLIDQGSLNKILFGGRPVEKVEITDRMEVSLGNTKIRFGKEEKAAMHTVAYQKNSFAEEWY